MLPKRAHKPIVVNAPEQGEKLFGKEVFDAHVQRAVDAAKKAFDEYPQWAEFIYDIEVVQFELESMSCAEPLWSLIVEDDGDHYEVDIFDHGLDRRL